MSLASFHYAFASREELLRELVQRVVGRELSAATAAWSPPERASPRACAPRRTATWTHLEREPGAGAADARADAALACAVPTLRPLARQQYRAYTGGRDPAAGAGRRS